MKLIRMIIVEWDSGKDAVKKAKTWGRVIFIAGIGLALPLALAAPAVAHEQKPVTIAANAHPNTAPGYDDDIGDIWNCVWSIGPLDCNTANKNASTASKTAQELAGNGTFPRDSLHNGKADAFRHCYWNALMVRSIGTNQAKKVATEHENAPKQPAAEKQMDLHNNAKGRDIGSKATSNNDAKNDCVRAAQNGTLKVLR